MANKMLIDASHQEETRVVVVRGNRIEEFDFESQHKKQLKGNIYLAKITRVEPSLQAAFVEYGGNRHGFLAFSEIHPDYYQIPKADRQALIEEELARAQEDEEQEERQSRAKAKQRPARPARREDGDSVSETAGDETDEPSGDEEAHVDAQASDEDDRDDEETGETDGEDGEASASEGGEEGQTRRGRGRSGGRRGRGRERSRSSSEDSSDDESGEEPEEIDDLGSEDAMEEVPVRQQRQRRQYKIQEVIKRRQILLVQVVKEERGNKGAALTTYLSLAGRYSVLMPNTARGGGISRKITNVADRKRLKDVVRELEVPRGMGIILRTAGANRTKAEVKRDYEYLMRLWETVRSTTLTSTAPALVYEEGSLIKRSIRDLYNKDIDQILVSGESGYREAKDFMRMLMPSQAKVVQPYRDPTPIFARQGIESQLDKMLHPHVTLKSGGYIIINQTEALVSIDVNSGRSTREHSIEDTALQTNLEASEEVARQLRLRDLAGLIVIDYIDMEEKRNNRAVEKRLKDCLKDDRARIQVGRISHFGLMEMSRQRIRASVLESTMQTCPVCEGAGMIRSSSSLALHVLRTIEEHLQKHSTHDVIVKVPTATALYVLNEKRKTIGELERHHDLRIVIEADDSAGHQSIRIEQGPEAIKHERSPEALALEQTAFPEPTPEDLADETVMDVEAEEIEAEDETAEETQVEARADGGKRRKRRRRRGRRGDEGQVGDEAGLDASESDDADEGDDETGESDGESDAEVEAEGVEPGETDGGEDDGRGRGKRRRRGRRGGRRGREENGEAGEGSDVAASDALSDAVQTPMDAEALDAILPEAVPVDVTPETEAEPAEATRAYEAAPTPEAHETPAPVAAEIPAEPEAADNPESAAANDDDREDESRPALTEPVVTSSGAGASSEDATAEKPRRSGWWSRRGFL
ncbi:ribonuclease E/G [Aurantimonas sp. Leaf443]|uniref:Rne/Rng family ribonuclease n=1 Tax=Aurantimonas sp. Leaf443 TaxID=1736378 RepID=UPI0006FF1271|nr:ribonuclease E/G [Aurantimonas sp. Leaf443]KQT83426.1 ribonuclease [Aurantimonas sp. Leaf443]